MTDSLFVRDVMLLPAQIPVIGTNIILKEALDEMDKFRLGIVCILDSDRRLSGVLTDGDIRRKLLHNQKPLSALFIEDAVDHSRANPVTARPDETLASAVQEMGRRQIWDLPVIDTSGMLIGLLHLHPAVEALLKLQVDEQR